MSTISGIAERHQYAGSGVARRLASAIGRCWVAYITWRMEQAAIIALRSMSDRELHDIGLARPEISGAVKRAAARAYVKRGDVWGDPAA